MKPEQIFTGTIRKCTKYKTHTTFGMSTYIGEHCIDEMSLGLVESDDEIYKENAVLLKVGNYEYVDLEKFNSALDYIKIYRDTTRIGGIVMSTSAYCEGNLFVDEKSLKPYYSDNQQRKNISVRQLKKQLNNVK